MSNHINEWEIVTLAAGWMNNLFSAHGQASPIKEVRVERSSGESRKRQDLTFLDHKGAPLVTGEVKTPWAADGHSPFVDSVVRDAREKAARAGVRWFFTWNLNQLVLWSRDSLEAGGLESNFQTFDIAPVLKSAQLSDPRIEAKLRDGLERFVLKLIELVREDRALPLISLDDYFVHALESFLKRPIEDARLALRERDRKAAHERELNRWAREQQGWTITDDRADLIERAAKFACYAMANKIVFYEALRKRFGRLNDLSLPAHVTTGDEALTALDAFFGEAKRESRDYETIFGLDRSDYGIRIPFLTDAGVEGWRGVLEHVEKFDFTRLDYDVVGRIFEKLISPEERHKFGQYYTRPEVVDLINAFCINSGGDRVLDPGCGGGTFLVRSYARRKYLEPAARHQELIADTFGFDVSSFAVHLTSINLASRELVEDENYPRIAREDFFDAAPGVSAVKIPVGGKIRKIEPGKFDAIIANPPYVRQEEIPKGKKKAYAKLIKETAGLKASGRSDIHIYFWAHAFNFLKENGRLGFLTSSQWLDVEYGFALQAWLLERFRIVAIIESSGEPWFEGARVATAAAILQREPDEKARAANLVRFVQLRRPIGERIIGGSRDMLAAAEGLRDDILAGDKDAIHDWGRVRCVPQAELLESGLALGERLNGERVYAGGKWGIHLRGPDVWRELIDTGGERWRPLGELAEIARGITSGCDKFFYVRDVSRETLDDLTDSAAFEDHYGVARGRVSTGEVALAKTGTGEVFPIEAEYLKPIVHSMMNVDAFAVEERHCQRRALTISSNTDLTGTFAQSYIEWGEEQDYDKGTTCAAREKTDGKRWYDLTDDAEVAPVFWVKERQYRFAALMNPKGYLANCRLYTVGADEDDVELVGAVLNSTPVILSTLLHGRPVGVEASWSTMVIDVKMMLTPDWTVASSALRKKLIDAGNALKKRAVLGMLPARRLREKSLTAKGRESELAALSDESELDQSDRRALDEAVLELLGVKTAARRSELLDSLYEYLHDYFETERRKEEAAIDNKARSKARQKQSPAALAQAVFDFIGERDPILLHGYDEFLDRFRRRNAPLDGRFIPRPERLEVVADLASTGLVYRDPKTRKMKIEKASSPAQAELMREISLLGEGGDTYFVPHEPADAAELTRILRAHREARERRLRELLNDRTGDPDMAEKAFERVLPKFKNASRERP